jgi:hypothetical protein
MIAFQKSTFGLYTVYIADSFFFLPYMFSAPVFFAAESCMLKSPKRRYRLGELGESWRIKMKMHTKV